MNNETPYSAVVMMTPEMVRAEVTIPGVQLFHYITDDQLNTLGEMRKEPVMEMCLASVGAFAGSIVPAIEQLAKFNAASDPMGWTGLVTVAICIIAGASSAITGFLWWQRNKSHKNLLEIIQSREKVPVKGGY